MAEHHGNGGLGTPVDLKSASDRPPRNYTLTGSALLANARKNLTLTETTVG